MKPATVFFISIQANAKLTGTAHENRDENERSAI